METDHFVAGPDKETYRAVSTKTTIKLDNKFSNIFDASRAPPH